MWRHERPSEDCKRGSSHFVNKTKTGPDPCIQQHSPQGEGILYERRYQRQTQQPAFGTFGSSWESLGTASETSISSTNRQHEHDPPDLCKVGWWAAASLTYTNTAVESGDSETRLKHTRLRHATYLGLKTRIYLKPTARCLQSKWFPLKGGKKEGKNPASKPYRSLLQTIILPPMIFFFSLLLVLQSSL